ncbi:MAG: AI-2E family transporter [Verrucomicrobiota bacterium]
MSTQLHEEKLSPIKTAGLYLGLIIFVGVIGVILWQALDILLLLFAGLVLGVAMDALRTQIAKRTRMPRTLALVIVILLLLGGFVGFLVMVTPPLVEQIKGLGPTLTQGWTDARSYLSDFEWGQSFLESIDSFVPEGDWLQWVGDKDVWSGLGGLFSGTLGILTSILFVFLSGIYISVEPSLYLNGTLKCIPIDRRDRFREVFQRIGYVLRWWLVGQLCSMVTLGVLMTIGLMILDVPMALAIGLFTALMTFIPNLGPIIAAVPALLMALTVSPATALYTLILAVIIQNLEGAIITPTIHRKIIAMPPILVIAVQLLLGSFVGFIGILVAMPIVATAMVLVQSFYIQDFLGDQD